MSRGIAASVAVIFAAVGHAATPAQKCQTGKNKVAGKYAYCRQKAEARLVTTGDVGAYNLGLQKCIDKFQVDFATLEQRAVNAGGACPSVGDALGIAGLIDNHSYDIASRLAGGPPAGCSANYAACSADLDTCETAWRHARQRPMASG